MVDAERGTATLGFSATSQPDGFWLRVYGERMQATANLFETRLTFDQVRAGPAAAAARPERPRRGPARPRGGDRRPPAQVPRRPRGLRRALCAARAHVPLARGRNGDPGGRAARAGGEPARGRPEAGERRGMKVLVTGANGFLGRHVVASLLGRGHQVRALVRPAARLEALGWPAEVEVVRADLRSSRELEPAFDGVDVLVHLAATMSGGDELQFAGTVVGTERLLAAMAATPCRRVVLASSFSVYDWSAIRGTLDETSPLEPAPELYERDGYSIAKSWQERVTRRLAGPARLGPHRAAPGLHLGAGPRLRGRSRPAGGTVPRRDRPPVALPAHARGELRRPVRARGHRPARGGRDLQRGGRRGRAHLELPGRVPAGDRGARDAHPGALRAGLRPRPAAPVPPSSRAARSCRRSWSRAASSRGSSRSATPTGARARSSGGARRSASRSAWRARSATDRGRRRRAGRRRPHARRAATSSP